jgi:hypothetical protein
MTFLFSKTERYLRHLLIESKRAKKLNNVKKRYLVIVVFVFLLICGIVLSSSGMASLSEVQIGNLLPETTKVNSVPPSIDLDAKALSEEIFGHKPEAENYYKQLISAYQESAGKDLLIIFNAGGWGTKKLEDSTDWISIMDGIADELGKSGYKVATLNFQRTNENLGSQLHEIESMVSGYYLKAKDLAKRVEFLTQHIAGLRVILAGESTGTMICDSTMNLLKDNTRVYSIQTGVPPWQNNTIHERTVVINDNGIVPDAFSQADLYAVIKSNFEMITGKSQASEQGKILTIFSAPGHEYWWQNPNVSKQISLFLEKHFGVQSGFQNAN